MKRLFVILAIAIPTLISAWLLLKLRAEPKYIVTTNGNSHETYFTVHNVAAARKVATGRGVKVGIIDHYFGLRANRALYAGSADFLDDPKSFHEIGEHGLWLATTLKEVAPDVQVFALNATSPDDEKKAGAVVRAIDWAIAHHLDVLTYSDRPFSTRYRPALDAAVERATAAGIVCIFTHYTHRDNLFPFGMFPARLENYEREPDINIFHYDYNTLVLAGGGASEPRRRYLSISSTSVVAAAFVAMLKQTAPALTPGEDKKILIDTSHPCEATEAMRKSNVGPCPRVVDIAAAVRAARGRADVQNRVETF